MEVVYWCGEGFLRPPLQTTHHVTKQTSTLDLNLVEDIWDLAEQEIYCKEVCDGVHFNMEKNEHDHFERLLESTALHQN